MDRAQKKRAAEMMRRLEELDRLDATHGLGSLPGSSTRPQPPNRRWGLRLVAVVVIGVCGLFAAQPDEGVRRVRALLGQAPEPLGAPPPTVTGLGTHAFVAEQRDGSPVTYDPCREIRYVVNPAGGPEGGMKLVEEAVAEVSMLTGLRFAPGAPSSARPGRTFPADLAARPPVLIAWSDESEVPGLVGEIAGLGGSTVVERGGHRWFATGEVVLDTAHFGPELASAVPGGPGWLRARAVVLHELGHLVGLDHVEDPAELMHAENHGQLSWGPGDREGLAELGRGRCR